LIFINDLDYGISNWILTFADDTKIFGSITSEKDIVSLQKDLGRLIQWADEWQMMFNTSKCKVMHFGKKELNSVDYYMSDQCLTSVTEEKDLGVVVSSDMKSSQQCNQSYSKASRMLAMINCTIVYKNSENLLRLYKSLVRPHLEYCTAAWSPHYIKDRVLPEKVQQRFTRMVPGLKKLPYEERLSELELWTMEERRVRADLIEVFKMVRELSAIKLETFFQLNSNGRTRGHQWKLKKRHRNTDLRQFFSERVINIWNSLDKDTVAATSINSFKGRLQNMRNKDESAFGLQWTNQL